jgi:hypothetical protein
MNSPSGILYDPSTAFDRLEAHVHRRLKGRVYGFRLVQRKGGLIVQGRANSYHIKQLATEAVKAATALPILANEITVSQLVPVLRPAESEEDGRDFGAQW